MSLIRKTIKHLLAFLFVLVILAPSFALADNNYGLDTAKGEAFGSTKIVDDLPTGIGKIVGFALSFVGVIFLILIIYAGFTWMLSRGNSTEAEKAKDIIIYAVIGLVVIFSAYAIVQFISSAVIDPNSI